MFLLELTLVTILLLMSLFSILKMNYEADKSAWKFMEEVRKIIGGNILERKILTYYLILKGRYKNREIECKYIRYIRSATVYNSGLYPTTYFILKSTKIPKTKKIFISRKISDNIRLKKCPSL
jgi:hypothetical protein